MIKTFYITRDSFADYIGIDAASLSYARWMELPRDHKVPALFVKFFAEIMLAWSKAQGAFQGDDEEAVETVIQYLTKNAAKMEEDGKRYRAPYVYRVCYNCLYCIVHDRKCDKQRREHEVSQIQYSSDGTEINLLQFVVRPNSAEDTYFSRKEINRRQFWSAVESIEYDTVSLINKILELGKIPDKLNTRDQAIVAELKVKLKAFNS